MFHDARSGEVRVIWKLLAYVGLVLLGHVAAFVLSVLPRVLLKVSPALVLPALGAVVVLIVTWFCLHRFERQRLGAVGIGADRPWVLHLFLGTAGGVGLVAVLWFIFRIAGWASSQMSPSTPGLLIMVIAGVLLCASTAAYEELLFRGYGFQILARWKMPAALLLSGILFIGFHLANKGGLFSLSMINVLLAHLLFAACYLKTRSLWLPMGIHAGWNFTEGFVFGMPLSGRVPKVSVFTTELQSNIWTGNEFGPEGGLLATVVLALATVAVWRLVKQRRPSPDLLAPQTRDVAETPQRRAAAPVASPQVPQLALPVQRLQALDVLRGAAILGILPMNIQLFAMDSAGFLNPYACAWTDNLNVGIWLVLNVVIGYKDLMVFSMLFGAGIIMMEARASASGRSATELHYRRMIVLLVFGLCHAYLIWESDILFTYAVCGCIVYLLRNMRPTLLLALGFAAYALPLLLLLALHFALPLMGEEAAASVYQLYDASPEHAVRHQEAYGGSWLSQMGARVPNALILQTVMLVGGFAWVAGGMMMVGIGLYRFGVLTAQRANRVYLLMIALAAFCGLPLMVIGLQQNFAAGWRAEYSFLAGRLYNDFASPIMALGWIGLIILVCRRDWLKWLTGPVSAVGRMALTNYLMHSVICSFIFYGHGLGMLGKIDRVGLLLIAVGIWIVSLICSPLWLRRFRLGPAEWLWRTLAYGRRQGMRKVQPISQPPGVEARSTKS